MAYGGGWFSRLSPVRGSDVCARQTVLRGPRLPGVRAATCRPRRRASISNCVTVPRPLPTSKPICAAVGASSSFQRATTRSTISGNGIRGRILRGGNRPSSYACDSFDSTEQSERSSSRAIVLCRTPACAALYSRWVSSGVHWVMARLPRNDGLA